MAALDDILGGSQPAAQEQNEVTSIPALASGTDATKIVSNPETPSQPAEQPPMSYVEMFKMLNPERPETAEEKAKREKREKGEAALAAVGDSISALSNLWFTSQYAPNAYDSSKGMSATTKERWNRLRQEREANRRAYSDGYMRAMAMDEAKDREDRNWMHTIEREKVADARFEVKEARDKALADLNEQLKRHQISEAGYKEEEARIKALFAEENEKLDLDYKQAGIDQRKAAAGASKASAVASYARARSYDDKVYGSFDGKTYKTKADYDKAVLKAAREYNKRHPKTEKRERTVYKDGKRVTETYDEKVDALPVHWNKVTAYGSEPQFYDASNIAAALEPRLKAEREKEESQRNNTMPGVGGNGGSANTMPGVK